MPTEPYDLINPPIGTPSVMEQLMATYHAELEARVEETLKDYSGLWDGVRAQLDATITRLEREMQAAVARGDTITAAWLSQSSRLERLKGEVQGNVQAFAEASQRLLADAQASAVELGTEAAQASLAATIPPGVSFTFGVPPQDVLGRLAGALEPYSPLYALFEQYGAQAAARAAQALFTSVALGENPRAAARRLEWATDMNAQRAEVIARTEIHRTWRSAQLANFQANSDVVSGWEWHCDFSGRTCGACLAMDGSIHPLDELLDDHICGRCSMVPVVRPWRDILGEEGIPAGELEDAENIPRRETGADWFARQSPTLQDAILGPAKATAYRMGDIALEDLAGVTRSATWGDSIAERSMKDLGLDAQSYLALARQEAERVAQVAAQGEGVAREVSAWEAERSSSVTQAEQAAAAEEVARPSAWEQARAQAQGGTPQQAESASTAEQAQAAPFGSVEDILARQQQLEDAYNMPMGDPTTMQRDNPEGAKVGVAEMGSMLERLSSELQDNRAFMRLAREFGYNSDQVAAWMTMYENWQRMAASESRDLLDAEELRVAALSREEAKAWAKQGALKDATYEMLAQYHSAPPTEGDITVWNSDPFQVAVLEAARREFGITAAHDYYSAEQLAAALEVYRPVMSGIRAWLRQMYTDTQAWYAEQGISTVQVFRGLRWQEGAQPAGVAWGEGLTLNVTSAQPLSSWASHAEVAYDYATGTGMNFFAEEPPDYSLVLVAQVPVEQILSTGYTGLGSTALRETMVMPGAYTVYAIPLAPGEAPGVEVIYQTMAAGGS